MTTNMIHNLERFRNCFCNKESGDSIVELLEFPQEKVGVVHVFRQEILFVIRGGAYIAMEGLGVGRRLKKGEFVFLPAGARLACEMAKDSVLLIVRVPADFPECPVFRMDRTAGNVTSLKDPTGIHPLKMNRRMKGFVSDIIENINDGFLCRHFLEGEANRALYLLNAYYPEEERVKFFSHILTPDIKFSEFVRMNHMKYRTIGELSDVLCMTPQAFANRFKKVFGMTPHKWMQQEKARLIYLDICRSDMPLKEIAIKYDFPLSSNFFRFCKQTFGESPGTIRKSLRTNITHN
jgi:AraC-like DNA-binding protein/quercetin dioxygenase-like cupin family protein